jgi:hypothetical protein
METLISWYDNFDNYQNGQYLDGGEDDGGWKLYLYNGSPDFGAFVKNEINRSYPNSLEIAGDSDILHPFDGYNSGIWNFSTWLYIPSDYIGESYFIISSYYGEYEQENFENSLTVVLRFESGNDIIISRESYKNLPLIFDQWIEILCIIDLDSDWLDIYYNGELLDCREWTASWKNNGNADLNIVCVDMWGRGCTPIYYDDFSLLPYGSEPDISTISDLNWVNVTKGETIKGEITVMNNGIKGTLLDWEIESWPEWGEWTFIPSSGDDLIDSTIIDVTVVAPNEEGEFTGEVKIINKENSSDFAILPVSLVITKIKSFTFIPKILVWLFERFSFLQSYFNFL